MLRHCSRPAGCPCRERSLTWHVPSHLNSLVDLLQHFNYSANLLCCGIASCRCHLHWPPSGVFGVFLPFIIFKFHAACARTRPKFKFLFLWGTANDAYRSSLAKSVISSGISLAHLSIALRNRPDEKRLAPTRFSLTPMVSSRFLSIWVLGFKNNS